jgi:hypothetical protein
MKFSHRLVCHWPAVVAALSLPWPLGAVPNLSDTPASTASGASGSMPAAPVKGASAVINAGIDHHRQGKRNAIWLSI